MATRVELSTLSPRNITDSQRPLNWSPWLDPLGRVAYSDNVNQYTSTETYNSPSTSQIQKYQALNGLNLFPSERLATSQQNNQVIPTVSPNTGAQNMFQNLRNKRESNILAGNFELSESPQSFNITPLTVSTGNNSVFNNPVNTTQAMIDRTMFNQLNNIRFPTQGNYINTPPNSQNIDMNFFRRSPPESMGSLQAQNNYLTVLAGQQPIVGTGANVFIEQNQLLQNQSRMDTVISQPITRSRGLVEFQLKQAQTSRSGSVRR